jgi:hypothetical protein
VPYIAFGANKSHTVPQRHPVIKAEIKELSASIETLLDLHSLNIAIAIQN